MYPNLSRGDIEIGGNSPSSGGEGGSFGDHPDKQLAAFITERGCGRVHCWRFGVDVVCTVLLFVVTGLLDMHIEPFHRVFYTTYLDPNTGNLTYVFQGFTDTDILYPSVKETVPDWAVGIGGTLIIVAVYTFLCLGVHRHTAEKYFVLLYRLYGAFQSVVLTLFLTQVLKLAVGELRPDFLARCQPVGVPPVCTGDADTIMEGRKSFPSGHSSLAWCLMTCVAVVLVHELQLFRPLSWRGTRPLDDEQHLLSTPPSQHHFILLRLLLAVLPWLLAALVSASRVDDYRHHPHDVFWGAVLGVAVSLTVAYAHFYQPHGFHLLDALTRARGAKNG